VTSRSTPLGAAAVLALVLTVSPRLANAQPPQGAAENEFHTVTAADQAQQEHLPATPLVFSAYGFVWVALATYVFTLWRRVGRVERELADVTSRLEAKRR
jgi:CcmD family protein